MIKINCRKILIFVAVCAAIVFAVSFGTRGKNYYLADRVLKELPITFKKGDDLSKVIAYLDKNKLNRGEVGGIKNGKLENADSRIENDGYIKQGAASELSMLIPEIYNYGFSVEGMLIVFYFDKNKKLMGYIVHKTGVSL